MNEHALILFAHGSPDARWRAPFERLHEHLSGRLGPNAVFLAYLEFCKPGLMDAVKTIRGRGIRRVHLLPLFMSAGGHVAADIPRQVREVKSIYRDLDVAVLPPVGEHPLLLQVMNKIALKAFTRPANPHPSIRKP